MADDENTSGELKLSFFVSWLPGVESQIPVTPTIERAEAQEEE